MQCPSGHSPPSSLEGTPLYSVTNTVLSVLLPTEHLSNPLFAFVSPFILEKNNDPKLKKPQSQTHRQKQPELQEQLTALEDGHVEPASPAREVSGSQRADTNCEDTNSSQHRVLLRHSQAQHGAHCACGGGRMLTDARLESERISASCQSIWMCYGLHLSIHFECLTSSFQEQGLSALALPCVPPPPSFSV